MKKWVVRFASLFVFNAVVLLLIGFLTPAEVGWAALWAAVVLTLLVLFVKPLVQKWFRGAAAKSIDKRTRIGEWFLQILIVLAVAAIVWILTVILTGVDVKGWLWGYILPPIIIAIGWAIYAKISDRLEAKAGEIYTRLGGGPAADAAASTPPSPASQIGRRELDDGLTAEQRRLLDGL